MIDQIIDTYGNTFSIHSHMTKLFSSSVELIFLKDLIYYATMPTKQQSI